MLTMTYNSVFFIGFFAAFLVVYLLMPKPVLRQIVILAGNVVFYKFAGGLNPMMLLVAVSVVVYVCSRLMGRIYEGFETESAGMSRKEKSAAFAAYKKRTKPILIAGIVLILGLLIYVKVGRLLHFEEVARLKEISFRRIIVPLGLSYFTFSAIGYLLDVFWRKAQPEKNYLRVLTAMTFFPIIIEGPITRYDKLMARMKELPGFDYQRVCFGLQRMFWGLFKKIVVADRLTLYTTNVIANLNAFAGVEVVLAVIGNALALYMDFSGCMDIVIGASECMGITLEENFRQPFFALSAAEFWRRWHITLGAWFKDYVYMPLAMNPGFMKKTGAIRKKYGARAGRVFSSAIPLGIVWILTGLWHGTGLDYLIWGIYWGLLIIIETAFAPEFKALTEKLHINTESFGYKFFLMARTFLYFCIGRMITAAGSAKSIILIVKRIFAEHRLWTLFDESLYAHGLDRKNFYVALFGILVVWGMDILCSRMKVREKLAEQPLLFRWILYYGLIFFVIVFGMYGSGYNASDFVYGGF